MKEDKFDFFVVFSVKKKNRYDVNWIWVTIKHGRKKCLVMNAEEN